MAISPDSTFLAVTARDQNQVKPSRLFLVQLGTFEVVREHTFEEIGFYDLAFIKGHDRLLAGVDGCFDDFESGLIEINPHSGEIVWKHLLGGIGVSLACRPHSSEVAVGFNGEDIRFYDSTDWCLLGEHRFKKENDSGRMCKVAYSPNGSLLAYGLSTGEFDIIERT